MQFFQRLFGPKNPTLSWVGNSALLWHVDLDACLFCGVPIGVPLQQLEPFGPAQLPESPGRFLTLSYPTRGFMLFLDGKQHLETVDINMLAEDDMVAFAGRWIYAGRPLTLTSTTTPAQVRTIFATLTPVTENDTFLAYYLSQAAIMFEWDKGRLENVMLDKKAD